MPPADRIAWLDLSGGVSGDMLLGACLAAGADPAAVDRALAALPLPETPTVATVPVTRGSLAATQALVGVPPSDEHRRLADVERLLTAPGLDPAVADHARRCFRRLAAAEARVHGVGVQEVHFHEVGALDSITDVVGVAAALVDLAPYRVVCSPIALGGGRVTTDHGVVPVPGPAVLALLADSPAVASGGPVDLELATPTGVALALTFADAFGPMPQMSVQAVGVGAGSRDPEGHANIARLVLGRASGDPGPQRMRVVEANVDDLDPRLWPPTLAGLLDAGAADAWLTPILMKKGRPAHTLSVLTTAAGLDPVLDVVFAHTSTIGLRVTDVDRVALAREEKVVEVDGHPVRVKVARRHGRRVNVSFEYDDVLAAARATGVPPTLVLDAARSAWHARGADGACSDA